MDLGRNGNRSSCVLSFVFQQSYANWHIVKYSWKYSSAKYCKFDIINASGYSDLETKKKPWKKSMMYICMLVCIKWSNVEAIFVLISNVANRINLYWNIGNSARKLLNKGIDFLQNYGWTLLDIYYLALSFIKQYGIDVLTKLVICCKTSGICHTNSEN